MKRMREWLTCVFRKESTQVHVQYTMSHRWLQGYQEKPSVKMHRSLPNGNNTIDLQPGQGYGKKNAEVNKYGDECNWKERVAHPAHHLKHHIDHWHRK
eukprot:388883-Pelagomonas_calceolata.AAC.1